MNKSLKIFGIVAILILVPFSIYAGIGIVLLNKIDYKLKGYKLKNIDNQFIYIDLILDIINPSKLDVHIYGYNFNIKLNGVPVANLINKQKKTLVGESTSPLTIGIAIDYKKSFGQILSKEILGYFLTKNYDKIIVSLSGKLKGELLKIPISTKLDFTYTLAEIEEIMSKSQKT